MLGSPDETPYDLRFRCAGIPVRVHPLFWLVMLLLGSQGASGRGELADILIFVACAFVSILVHEMGHGLASRAVGVEPTGIVLYAMGGFCQFTPGRQTPGERLFVLLLGPGAGFALLGIVLAFTNARFGVHPLDAMAMIGVGPGEPIRAFLALGMMHHSPVVMAVYYMLWINFWWGVFNLFPIWPLDGGQATGVVLGVLNPREGMRWTHTIGLLTAAGLAVYRYQRSGGNLGAVIWIAYFALINFQMLQTLQANRRFTDDHWWQR